MLSELWKMVNSASTLQDVDKAEKAIKEAGNNITNDEFDELMQALTYIQRECYHRK